jgi:hypothetical protein
MKVQLKTKIILKKNVVSVSVSKLSMRFFGFCIHFSENLTEKNRTINKFRKKNVHHPNSLKIESNN